MLSVDLDDRLFRRYRETHTFGGAIVAWKSTAIDKYSTFGTASAVSVHSSPRLESYAIRHSPRPVRSALGEAFYRFAA